MISIVGIGTGASRIAELFSEIDSYRVYRLNDGVKRNSKYHFRLHAYETPEEYEKNIPNLSKFFKDINDHVQVLVMGSSASSNYTLGILEQIRDKKIDLYYIKPDAELLTGVPKLVDNAVFGVLQEYARSGLLNSFAVLSNMAMEEALHNIPIKKYYDSLNKTIFQSLHYINYFNHTEPEIGMLARPLDINRIKTLGMLDPSTLEEKWFFELDTPRDICYYICINQEKLEQDGTLHRRLVKLLKEKPRNAFRRVSYAIYETPYENDFGFCVAHTNVIQKNS